MPAIEVLLEVPPAIVQGLANGTLERVGGVIRNSRNGQIVAHLREGGQISSNSQLTQGLMGGLLGHAGMSSATISTIIFGTARILNTAIAGFTLLKMIQRFQALEKQVQATYERMGTEFNQDRQIDLESALASVRNMIEAEGDSYKQEAPGLNRDLDKARRHILRDVDAVLLEDSPDPGQSQNAQDALLGAMHVDTMGIRCHLEIDEHKLARDQLKDVLEEHKKRTQTFVLKWLGAHPARYFHEKVTDEDLARYIRIEGWLRGKDDVLMELVETYRHDFWNEDAIKSIKPRRSLRSRHSKEPTHHLTALTQAELLIENFQRLEGFEGELNAIERLGLKEWEDLASAADFNIDEHNDYVLLVDKDRLAVAEQLGW